MLTGPNALDVIKYVPFSSGANFYLTVGGEIRERYEHYDNSIWGRGPQDTTGYVLQRYMVHTDAHLGDYFRVFVQFKSGLEEGRNGGPRPIIDEDEFDLGQAFLDGKTFWSDSNSLVLRVGRQELFYGSGRLVSTRESPNVRLSYDGAKSILQIEKWELDAFAVKPVLTNPGILDDDPDPTQTFWGLYSTLPVPRVPGLTNDLYYLGLRRLRAVYGKGIGNELRHSIGTRFFGRKSKWDYETEFVGQFGRFGSGDIHAWEAVENVGYTLQNAPFQPRLGLETDATSGDNHANSSDLGTFNPLFLKGPRFGDPFLVAPANRIDLHPEMDLHLSTKVRFATDWEVFWRESVHDALYTPPGIPIQPARTSDSRYVGNQLTEMLDWKASRNTSFALRYSHFFAGEFLEAVSPAKDVNYLSTTVTIRF